jgi:hypothetical protein
MIVERQLEVAIIAAISKLGIDARIVGAWDDTPAGVVKGTGDASKAAIAVVVAPRAYDGFLSSQADFACSIAVTVRRDSCPMGEEIAEIIEPLFVKLREWNCDEDAVFADLTTEGFNPAGISLTGGSAPTYDSAAAVWSVAQTFTVRGIIS